MALGHCPQCGLEWVAMGEAHCSACHVQFGSNSAFDRHRVGNADHRRCMTAEEMERPREKSGKPTLVATMRSSGVVWVTSLREVEA